MAKPGGSREAETQLEVETLRRIRSLLVHAQQPDQTALALKLLSSALRRILTVLSDLAPALHDQIGVVRETLRLEDVEEVDRRINRVIVAAELERRSSGPDGLDPTQAPAFSRAVLLLATLSSGVTFGFGRPAYPNAIYDIALACLRQGFVLGQGAEESERILSFISDELASSPAD
jgi:hypothetical protein